MEDMHLKVYTAQVGERYYHFERFSDSLTAKCIYAHFTGNQDQLEQEFEKAGIMFVDGLDYPVR